MGTRISAVFCDEFAFYNSEVLTNAIFPTLATGATLVMTSSISPDGDSPIMKILDVKYDDGSNVIKKLNWIQVCHYFFSLSNFQIFQPFHFTIL
jgi:hypothetical protein